MFRVHRLTIVVLIAVLIGAVGFPAPVANLTGAAFYGPLPALAQSAKPKKKRRSLFSILFGRKKAKKKATVKNSKRSKRSKKSRKAKRTTKTKVVATAKAVKKLDDARVILVIGDFVASSLADGLTTALAQVPSLKVVDKSKGLSGFIRTDIVDWAGVLPALVEEHNPAYVVVLLGSNDRQRIRSEGKRHKKLTPAWVAAYSERVKGLGNSLETTGVNYSWVGLPPVRSKSMSKDFLRFNELFDKAVASQRGQFIDVWDGFSDADGNYSRSGPDVNGQIVLLRSKDGINMTRAGKRRLAYYVEGRIQKLFGGGLGGAAGLASSGIDWGTYAARSPQYDPAITGKTFVVRLDDPTADGGDTLAGEKIELTPGLVQSEALKSSVNTAITANNSGRVDNHSWPPQDGPVIAPIAIAAPASNGSPTGLRSTLAAGEEPGEGQGAAALQN